VSGAILAISLGALWLEVWWRQHVLWDLDAELRYGWVVPLLVVFVALERLADCPAPSPSRRGSGWAFLGSGLALLPLCRAFLEAFPSWTAMLWAQALVAGMISLGLAGGLGGRRWVRHFAFSVGFALTALPWPASLQQRIIPPLTQCLAAASASALNELGHPAIAHGNLVESGGGWVGVEEACGGVRSLQCAVMVALFAGEYLRLSGRRRAGLLAVGIVLALGSNFLRVGVLAWQGARGGQAAIERWHDPTGYGTYFFLMAGIAGAAWLLARSRPSPVGPASARRPSLNAAVALLALVPRRRALMLPALVLAAVAISEAGVQAWFGRTDREASLGWTYRMPEEASDFQLMNIPAPSQALLQCDRAVGAFWSEADGSRRGAYFIHWGIGRGGHYLSQLHNPLACLPAAGARLVSEQGPALASLGGHPLAFRALRFEADGQPFTVFYTVAEMGIDPLRHVTTDGSPVFQACKSRWAAVAQGRRGDEVQLLAIILWNPGASEEASFQSALAQVTVPTT
jgi:exosortase